jgi:cytochrome b
VWDAAVRLLHWLLAGLVLFDYFIDDEGGFLHRTVGYVAVGVVISRLIWSGLGDGANGFAALRLSAGGWSGCSGRWCCCSASPAG